MTEATDRKTATADTSANTAVAVDAVGKIQVVAVVFSEAGQQEEYNYFAPDSARSGQYAVVYQASGNSEFPFKVVRIVRDHVIDVQGLATKSIWGSFDEAFAQQVQARTEHLARVKAMLAQKKRQFEEQNMFAIMAQTDPEVAALLAELAGSGL